MTSDDTKSTTDVPWRQVGIGLVIRLRCFSCNTTKARTGGKMFGPGKKLFRCAACIERKEQEQAMNEVMLAAWKDYRRTITAGGQKCGPTHMKAFLAGWRASLAQMVIDGRLAA